MKLFSQLLICLFCFCISPELQASKSLPNTQTHEICEASESQTYQRNVAEWLHQNSNRNRTSFPTLCGFVLVRKEEIISIAVDQKSNALVLNYRNRGVLKTALCNISLSKALDKLNAFPFVKISRSTIVNLDEADAYEGTRRDGHLVMSDGTKVRVSRSMSGLVHDWFLQAEA